MDDHSYEKRRKKSDKAKEKEPIDFEAEKADTEIFNLD